jgi:hypothetical protein
MLLKCLARTTLMAAALLLPRLGGQDCAPQTRDCNGCLDVTIGSCAQCSCKTTFTFNASYLDPTTVNCSNGGTYCLIGECFNFVMRI